MRADDAFSRYLQLFETLTPQQIDAFDALTTDDVRFTDPFSDIAGRAAFKRVFAKMFADVAEPRFIIRDVAARDERRYVRWRFEGRAKRGGRDAIVIEGMSEVHLAGDGRIARHVDHWDAASQVYERVPLLGTVLRQLRRRLGVSR